MKKSFTLIEILVVATIIGLLAAGAAVSYSQFSKQSRDAKRKADLEQIRAALEMYRSNNNSYPTTITISCSSSGGITDASNTYLSQIPKDPKCSTYTYYGSISTNDYTLAAYLEAGGTTCVAGQCGGNCNYCVGPYGQR
jgi:general secretion pathway protein G